MSIIKKRLIRMAHPLDGVELEDNLDKELDNAFQQELKKHIDFSLDEYETFCIQVITFSKIDIDKITVDIVDKKVVEDKPLLSLAQYAIDMLVEKYGGDCIDVYLRNYGGRKKVAEWSVEILSKEEKQKALDNAKEFVKNRDRLENDK